MSYTLNVVLIFTELQKVINISIITVFKVFTGDNNKYLILTLY